MKAFPVVSVALVAIICSWLALTTLLIDKNQLFIAAFAQKGLRNRPSRRSPPGGREKNKKSPNCTLSKIPVS